MNSQSQPCFPGGRGTVKGGLTSGQVLHGQPVGPRRRVSYGGGQGGRGIPFLQGNEPQLTLVTICTLLGPVEAKPQVVEKGSQLGAPCRTSLHALSHDAGHFP